jgi:hypothetical protein
VQSRESTSVSRRGIPIGRLNLKYWENRSSTKFANPEFWRKKGIGNYFLEKLRNECETASQRNLNRQEDEALVGGRQVSSDRSNLPHMASEEKLSAALRQIPGNYENVES